MRNQITALTKQSFRGSRLNVLTASRKTRTPKHAKVDRRNDDHFLSHELTDWDVAMLDRLAETGGAL